MPVDSGGNEAVRQTLRRSTDPRVARTRAGILAAVHALGEAGQELSVSSISRAAGISRASFYAHYASLDALASSLHAEAFRSIGDLHRFGGDDPADAQLQAQERLVAHFAEHRALYAAVAALPVSKVHYLAGVREMAAVVEELLVEHPRRPAELQPAATARYVAGAAYGLLDAWVAGDVDLPGDRLAEHLFQLLPTWFSGAAEPTPTKDHP
jgi:AcrR family transcriptional regulator